MYLVTAGILLVCLVAPLFAQDSHAGPTDKKAQKSYQQAQENLQKGAQDPALWYFREADKQDHGHCLPCEEQMVRLGLALQNWKAMEDGAAGMAALEQDPKQQAIARYYLGMALMNEGIDKHQNDMIVRSHDEFSKAISLYPNFRDIFFEDGKALAQLHKDDEAKTEFQKFVAMTPEGRFQRQRALQFISKPELARTNLVSDFATTTADGRRVSAGSLVGKVTLVYFWSASCDSCVRAFPHLRAIANKFQNSPFVILSITVDHDIASWRSFLEKNDVPGMQAIDGFNGPLARAFGMAVHFETTADHPLSAVWQTSYALKQDIPKTFTIDADGVLQSEKLSDSIDAKLQELIAHTGQNEASK